jgi:hypothetical protein
MEQACDVGLLIPSWSSLKDWRDRSHLYVRQRPLSTEPGSRVWLCKGRRFVYSYCIDGFVELDEAVDEAGWAFVVSDGRAANRDIERIPDPHGVATRWMQGFRYLAPGAKEFVKAPRRPRAAKPAVVPAPTAEALPGPVAADPTPKSTEPTWAGRLARRLGRSEKGG